MKVQTSLLRSSVGRGLSDPKVADYGKVKIRKQNYQNSLKF